MTNLESLNLTSNLLTGTLPESLSDMKSLVELKLDANSFTGTIPNRLTQLNNLSTFWASSNNLTMFPPVNLGFSQALDSHRNS